MTSKVLPDELIALVPAMGAIDEMVPVGGKLPTTAGSADPSWDFAPIGQRFLFRKQWSIQQLAMNTAAFDSQGVAAPTINTPGAAVAAEFGATGGFVLCQTGTTLDADAGLVGATVQTRPDHDPYFGFKIRAAATVGVLTNSRWWVGVFSATPMASGVPAISYAAFRYDTALDANWKALLDNGSGAPTLVANGATPVAGVNKEFGIKFRNGGTVVDFFQDGLHLGTSSTKIPATTTNLQFYAQVRQRLAAATTKAIGIQRIACVSRY